MNFPPEIGYMFILHVVLGAVFDLYSSGILYDFSLRVTVKVECSESDPPLTTTLCCLFGLMIYADF